MERGASLEGFLPTRHDSIISEPIPSVGGTALPSTYVIEDVHNSDGAFAWCDPIRHRHAGLGDRVGAVLHTRKLFDSVGE